MSATGGVEVGFDFDYAELTQEDATYKEGGTDEVPIVTGKLYNGGLSVLILGPPTTEAAKDKKRKHQLYLRAVISKGAFDFDRLEAEATQLAYRRIGGGLEYRYRLWSFFLDSPSNGALLSLTSFFTRIMYSAGRFSDLKVRDPSGGVGEAPIWISQEGRTFEKKFDGIEMMFGIKLIIGTTCTKGCPSYIAL